MEFKEISNLKGRSKLIIYILILICFFVSFFSEKALKLAVEIMVEYLPEKFNPAVINLDFYFIENFVLAGLFIFLITSFTIILHKNDGNNRLTSNDVALFEGIQSISVAFIFIFVLLINCNRVNNSLQKDSLIFIYISSASIYILISYNVVEYYLLRRIKLELSNWIIGGNGSETRDAVTNLNS